ncbi:hypothetical protein Ddye_019917 [Dipteronia dyeriana]|uniref:Peptidyl-prolyl cis-trans isomerase n=1 Tax=Dipteronia dyeriana TaxID=168575 RepID=A0AAD9TYZ3_9ROSI|nr:hypothetical protein Ddye_019917 [Dipteronia dyeriana]
MELFTDNTPITMENFQALCTGEKGINKVGKLLHNKGLTFHCMVPGYMVHGGDITNGNGTGGDYIYGPIFTDEKEAYRFQYPINGQNRHSRQQVPVLHLYQQG